MKTKEELNALKNEVEALNDKLRALSEEDLEQVAGGLDMDDGIDLYEIHEKLLEAKRAMKEQAEKLKEKR